MCALLTMVSVGVCAQSNEGIRQFKEFLTQVDNASGEFSQQQLRPMRAGETQAKVLRKSQGVFIFSRPSFFVWETKKPFEQKIISNGQELLLWDKDLNQLTIKPVGQSLQSTPAAILFGQIQVEEKFDLIAGYEKGGMYWLELVPKSQTSSKEIPYARVGIGMKEGVPAGLELHDNFGHVIVMTLSKMKTNQVLPSGTFKFSPPAGADVLRVQQ